MIKTCGKTVRHGAARCALAFVLAMTLLCALLPVSAAGPELEGYSNSFQRKSAFTGVTADTYAVALEGFGLFLGTGRGFELERTPNRAEALVSVIRLMGAEDEAREKGIESYFPDVPDWASAYAGYARANGVTMGMPDGTFGAADDITAKQFVTMMLRVLGYDDAKGDFEYDGALEFAYEINIIDEWELNYYSGGSGFTRGDMSYILYRTLYSEDVNGAQLILTLLGEGAITYSDVCGILQRQGESDSEITRAVSNGFSQAWLLRLHTAIDENENIPSDVKTLFKQSVYNWLKEPGMDAGFQSIEQKLRELLVTKVARDEDYYFYAGYAVAYFQFPNLIVLRNDMDLTSYASTVAHELRHAMTDSLYPTILEEGFTEFWSQEVDEGDYSYPYYYVNAAKLLTHLAGAKAANGADLSGGYEKLFYAIEKRTGVSFDKSALYENIYDLNYMYYYPESSEPFCQQLLAIIKDYYDQKLPDILEEAGGWKRFIDEMIVLGQLLYYPSAAVQRAESDLVEGSPRDYYSTEFVNWAGKVLDKLATATGVSVSELSEYWQANYDTRMYIEYYGEGTGNVFEAGADAYCVGYNFDGYRLSKLYGDRGKAERFSRIVGGDEIITVSGAGFTQKAY